MIFSGVEARMRSLLSILLKELYTDQEIEENLGKNFPK
jgi:hypothetical protein